MIKDLGRRDSFKGDLQPMPESAVKIIRRSSESWPPKISFDFRQPVVGVVKSHPHPGGDREELLYALDSRADFRSLLRRLGIDDPHVVQFYTLPERVAAGAAS